MAKKFVFNHIVKGQYSTQEISSNLVNFIKRCTIYICIYIYVVSVRDYFYFQVVTSLEQNYPLRFQVYRDNFGIENALIEKSDKKASNGILHVISHVLHPATISLDDILRNDGNFR